MGNEGAGLRVPGEDVDPGRRVAVARTKCGRDALGDTLVSSTPSPIDIVLVLILILEYFIIIIHFAYINCLMKKSTTTKKNPALIGVLCRHEVRVEA